jgi:hypothetical protein
LFIIVPYQKRPWRSHLPSLERFFGLSFSGATKRLIWPVAGSKKSMPVWAAMMSPPFARTDMAVTISGMSQCRCPPLAGCQRWMRLDGTSVQ